MKERPLRVLLWAAIASVAAVVMGAYAYARHVGIEVSTSADAFVLPARAPPSSKLPHGSVRTIVEITPAPWPSEARTIHRVASLGIPVRVVVRGDHRPIRFVVQGADDQLAAVFQSQSDAEALDLMVPKRP